MDERQSDLHKEPGFEEKLRRIEEINSVLADGKADLEQSVTLYEEGMTLARSLEKDLSALERRIEIVTNNPEPDGSEGLETADFNEKA